MQIYYKRIQRTIMVPCPHCWGRMHTIPRCTICNDTGEVARTINELVPVTGDEANADAEAMLGWAGAVR